MSSQQEVGIFTDRLSNLQTIKKGVAKTAEQEVLLRTLAQHQVKLSFHHVRSHQDNQKNIEVDRLCDISIEHPDRLNSDDQGGKKTSAKIKSWMDEWIRTQGSHKMVNNRQARQRGSATQIWMEMCLTDNKGVIKPPPITGKHLPRRQGVLISKARANRWT